MVLNNNSTFKPIVCLFSLSNGWMADRYCAGYSNVGPILQRKCYEHEGCHLINRGQNG